MNLPKTSSSESLRKKLRDSETVALLEVHEKGVVQLVEIQAIQQPMKNCNGRLLSKMLLSLRSRKRRRSSQGR